MKNKPLLLACLLLGQILMMPLSWARDDVEAVMKAKLMSAFPGQLELTTLVLPEASRRYFEECRELRVDVLLPIRSLSHPSFNVSCLDSGLSRRVRARANGTVQAVLSTSRIHRDQTILGSQVMLQEMPLRTYRHNLILNKNEVFGRKVKRRIPERTWVLESHLEKRYDIQAGEVFTLTASATGISFSMDAQALEGGIIGQSIKAKNLSSGEIFEVIVTKRGEATLK